MDFSKIYPVFHRELLASTELSRVKVARTINPIPARRACFSTSLFLSPEGHGVDDFVERKKKTWRETYLEPLGKAARSGFFIRLYIDPVAYSCLQLDLPSNVEINVMQRSLPGYDAMLWRYLGAMKGNCTFIGCDDFSIPQAAKALMDRTNRPNLVRWISPKAFDEESFIYRTIKGAFSLLPTWPDIDLYINDWFDYETYTLVEGKRVFGETLHSYGRDEVFTCRTFYWCYLHLMGTVVLPANKPTNMAFVELDLATVYKANLLSSTIIG